LGSTPHPCRKERGLSQEEIAFDSGVDRSFLSHIERSLQQSSISTLFRIAETLGTPVSTILAEAEKEIQKK